MLSNSVVRISMKKFATFAVLAGIVAATACFAAFAQDKPVAAEGGFDMARFKLGVAYETGTGVAQDDQQAANWYRQAAAQRNTFARDKLQFGFGSIAGVPEAKN
jgi:TPR repeat protein